MSEPESPSTPHRLEPNDNLNTDNANSPDVMDVHLSSTPGTTVDQCPTSLSDGESKKRQSVYQQEKGSFVSEASSIKSAVKEEDILKTLPTDKKDPDRIFFVNGGEKVKQPQKYSSNSISTTKYIIGFRIHKNGWKLGPWGPIGLPPHKDRNGNKVPGAKRRPFDLPYIQPPFFIQNLYEQFHRIANLYFILIIILQLIPGLSPTGQFSTLLPFAIVTIFSLLKDMLEDMKRRISDLKTNRSSKATVFRSGEWCTVKWKDVKVGDIIKVVNKERFPCDIILLSSSQAQGLAYVETASLDGETNLKVKKALDDTMPLNLKSVRNFKARFLCQKPNKNLHKLNGRIYIGGPYIWDKVCKTPDCSEKDPLLFGKVTKLHVSQGDQVKEGQLICDLLVEETGELKEVRATHSCTVTHLPLQDTLHEPGTPLWKFTTRLNHLENVPILLSDDQQLLRGSTLQNTDWIVGVVMYTGHQSKLLMNQNATPHKSSKVERLTNRFIIIIFVLLGILCLICAVGKMVWTAEVTPNQWYLQEYVDSVSGGEVFWSGFSGFFTFLILFNNLVPISLYVSMEMAKFAQAFFMSQDRDMYYEENDVPTVVRSSSLNEELGQIEYIFSDKTGTLTRNKMDFLKFSVNGEIYGTGITEIERANAKRHGRELFNDRPPGFNEKQDFRFWDGRINDGKWIEQQDSEDIDKFLKLLALCHTVIPERDDEGVLTYNSSSPDEGALVKAARHLGVEFISRTTRSMTIRVNGVEETWQLLNILEFNSTRKRMSVIVRNPEGELILYCKGADNVIYDRLDKSAPTNHHADKSLKILEELADAGLRTLVCAEAKIDEVFYEEWRKEHQEALMITNPEEKEEALDSANEKIEKNLQLVGLTAIEDLLQIGVPDTIAELKKGLIKVWVLTGDKQETAKNIGFACDLLNTDMDLIEMNADSPDELSKELVSHYERYKAETNRINGLGLVVSGEKLTWIMESDHLKLIFLELGTFCEAVVCCRVSPLQKSQVVNLVRKNMNTITLAIGDGANDVPMIQSAHVGIGISGEEGQQAANSSDYSFGQFRFLKRLLLVHGQYSYRRISKLILYSFYKNIVLFLTQLWYVFFNSFSGTSVHDKWTISAFNVLFAFLPIMALGIFDQHVTSTKALEFPQMYARGHRNVYFNFWNFLGWVLNAVYHSCICFFVPILCMYYPDVNGTPWDGSSRDMIGLGLTIYTSVLLTITGKVHLEMQSYTLLHAIANLGSLLIWWVFIILYATVFWVLPYTVPVVEEAYDINEQYRSLVTPRFILTIFLTATLALWKDFIWKAAKRFLSGDIMYAVQDATAPRILLSMTEQEREETVEKWGDEKKVIVEEHPVKAKPAQLKGRSQSKIRAPVELDIKKFSQVVPHRGFAFSQTPGQGDLLNRILGTSNDSGSPEKKSKKSATESKAPTDQVDGVEVELDDVETFSDSHDNEARDTNSHVYSDLGTTFEV